MLSVILCTHNPRRTHFEQTLSSLRGQTLPVNDWELLVIDNASAESVASHWDLSWHVNGRHLLETSLGLTPARCRGIRESRGSVLVFVDDDNVLQGDYLQNACAIAGEKPWVGAWGGHIDPSYQTEPPEYVQHFRHCLALLDVSSDRWSNFGNDTLPVGAGLCVRRVVAERYVAKVSSDAAFMAMDRRGNSLIGGGDTDLALTAHEPSEKPQRVGALALCRAQANQ